MQFHYDVRRQLNWIRFSNKLKSSLLRHRLLLQEDRYTSQKLEGMMDAAQERKGAAFKCMHEAGMFVMPNAWDVGSAKFLTSRGYTSIGTTSAGIAYALGYRDSDPRLIKELMFEVLQRIVNAVDVPVSADLENGFGSSPRDVASTIVRSIEIGCAGGSIEDVADYSIRGRMTLASQEQAVAKILAARAEIDRMNVPFILTARTECFLTDHPSPLDEAVKRLTAFRDAGADCVFAPGAFRVDDIELLVKEVGIPLNVLVTGRASSLTVETLRSVGVRRVSTGSSIARLTYAAIEKASSEMSQQGSFTFGYDALNADVLDNLFDRDA